MAAPVPPAEPRSDPLCLLEDLVGVHGDALPLDQVAALVAMHEDPAQSVDGLLRRLDRLAAPLQLGPQTSVFEAVARLNQLLFTDEGFRGDEITYDDPANSCLNRVLDRRAGLPILLSVIYIEVARRAGLTVHGVAFPMHFLVTPQTDQARFFIDPFHGGRVIREDQLRGWLARMMDSAGVTDADWERLVRPASGRAIAARINVNLQMTWRRRGEPTGALRAVERLVRIAHDPWGPRRDRGLLLAELGQHQEAQAELEAYLDARPGADDADKVRQRLERLRVIGSG